MRRDAYRGGVAVEEGVYPVGPGAGHLRVRTARAGFGRGVGHDLTLEVVRWEAHVVVGSDAAGSSVTVRIDAGSFAVLEGTGGVLPLTDDDRAEIVRTIDRILRTAEHPAITFASTRIDGAPDALRVTGDLVVRGTSRPVEVTGSVTRDGRVQGSATVVQSRWGITPYSAFLGALRVANEVRVEFDLDLSARQSE